jgi:VWFA-related protein
VPADSALFSIAIVGHYVLETLQNAKIVARKGMTHALFQNSWFLVFCDFNRAATGFGVSVWLVGSASPGEKPPAGNPAPFQLKVTSNLVVVRVVVRDAGGKPVEGLRKEDFKLFDRGEEQSIKQFEEESSVAPLSSPVAARTPGQAAPPSPPAAVTGKFIALYFDDLNTSASDMIQARDAADHYLSANLQPRDQVAIFTSEQALTDFTSDPKQIHEALFKLHVSSRALTRNLDCPNLSDYQALQITENPNDQNIDAWKLANDEVAHCGASIPLPSSSFAVGNGGGAGMGNSPPSPGSGGGPGSANGVSTVGLILNLARNIVYQAEILAPSNLQQLEQVVKHISQKPGQRSITLVSPGFLSQSELYQLDRIIDLALRSQVVISSLDPKGLAILMRESDASQKYIPSGAGGGAALRAAHNLDSGREFVATSVLAAVAEGTGGEFFHNSNDLKAGFGALAGSPVSYILAIAPRDIKPDGKFHELKVTLAEKQKGFSIQARRGYFAPENEEQAETQIKELELPSTAPRPETQIQEAILSKSDMAQLPVELTTKLSGGQGETRELSLFTRLDAKSLRFHKEGEHNLNTVTFLFAVFDQGENLIEAQQRRAKVSVLDGQLPDLFKAGVYLNLTFQLKPGTYRVREVVTDSEDHQMTTLSRSVTIP